MKQHELNAWDLRFLAKECGYEDAHYCGRLGFVMAVKDNNRQACPLWDAEQLFRELYWDIFMFSISEDNDEYYYCPIPNLQDQIDFGEEWDLVKYVENDCTADVNDIIYEMYFADNGHF